MIYIKSEDEGCKNTGSSLSARVRHLQAYVPIRIPSHGVKRSAECDRFELFIEAFGREICGGHRSASDRKISYLRHTPCAPRNALRILKSSPWARYRVGDKTTSSIWCACKNKGSSRNPPAVTACVLRRPITRIDLVASSIYIENVSRGRCLFWQPEARKIRQHAHHANCYRRRKKDTQVMIERPPTFSYTRWFSYSVIRGSLWILRWSHQVARWCPRDIIRSLDSQNIYLLTTFLVNTYLKYVA